MKILSDGQQLEVPAPPDQAAAAVIEVRSAGEDQSAASDADIVLRGTVSRLSLEKKTNELFATILVGDLPFTVRVPFEKGQEHAIFPGKTISVRYRRDRIKWI